MEPYHSLKSNTHIINGDAELTKKAEAGKITTSKMGNKKAKAEKSGQGGERGGENGTGRERHRIVATYGTGHGSKERDVEGVGVEKDRPGALKAAVEPGYGILWTGVVGFSTGPRACARANA